MTFSEFASNSYIDQLVEAQRQQREERAAIERETKKQFAKFGGNRPFTVRGNVVDCDGIKLEYMREADSVYWTVQGVCPKCNQMTTSQICRDLADIGEQIVSFRPGYSHRCRPADSVETADPTQDMVDNLIKRLSHAAVHTDQDFGDRLRYEKVPE